MHLKVVGSDALDVFLVGIEQLLAHQIHIVPRGPFGAGGAGKKSQKHRREMFVVDLSMDMKRSFDRDVHLGQFLLRRKCDVVEKRPGMQGLQRAIIIHGVVQIGAQGLFQVRGLRDDRIAIRIVPANALAGRNIFCSSLRNSTRPSFAPK